MARVCTRLEFLASWFCGDAGFFLIEPSLARKKLDRVEHLQWFKMRLGHEAIYCFLRFFRSLAAQVPNTFCSEVRRMGLIIVLSYFSRSCISSAVVRATVPFIEHWIKWESTVQKRVIARKSNTLPGKNPLSFFVFSPSQAASMVEIQGKISLFSSKRWWWIFFEETHLWNLIFWKLY